ncbi:hypothetical protein P171DRAFT_430555 [Karstenula rhodostoma CBS 690.94]|uniref:Uncharacterized protein n=1 Tax=Karstenula rhodostoma CBS 690.94 TaxID=1392251 RepID=A0A9P4UEN3_9PLEO|nr:hypothetical protein P171DRAFT_430555 [Karstenula rhodostoma CBS 690.94]
MSRFTTREAQTAEQLSAQWINPSDVLSVLLLIGGDIVQKALAQTTGGILTPVCFSFGWVAYSLTALVGLFGDGRLLPAPDYPTKVINLQTGYTRENRNWIIGRILRDDEIHSSMLLPQEDKTIHISVYCALPTRRLSLGTLLRSLFPALKRKARTHRNMQHPMSDDTASHELTSNNTTGPEHPMSKNTARAATGVIGLIGMVIIVAQFVLAAVPVLLYREWEVLLITAVGTSLVQLTACLPQWQGEKIPTRGSSHKYIALTTGNGSRHIMVVIGAGNAIDLEELAASETPRSNRFWQKIRWLSRPIIENGRPKRWPNDVPVRQSYMFLDIPAGFWVTIITMSVQSILWLALLITVAGIKSHTWYLLGVGILGMFQNAIVAAVSRGPEKRCLPLKLVDTISASKVMDGLMDFEWTYPGYGQPLLHEFFTGGDVKEDEKEWWDKHADWKEYPLEDKPVLLYDQERLRDKTRGDPRSSMPNYINPRLSLLLRKPPLLPQKSTSFGKDSSTSMLHTYDPTRLTTLTAAPNSRAHSQSPRMSSRRSQSSPRTRAQSPLSRVVSGTEQALIDSSIPNNTEIEKIGLGLESWTPRSVPLPRMTPPIEEHANEEQSAAGVQLSDDIHQKDFSRQTKPTTARQSSDTARGSTVQDDRARPRRLSMQEVYDIAPPPDWA